MTFAKFRHTLFTVHMWVGLILGVLLAVLGLSGSLLVYDQQIADFLSPPPMAATAGMPLPLSMLSDIARRAAAENGIEGGQMQILPPEKPRGAVVVRFGGISPMGAGAGATREGGRRENDGERRREGAAAGGRGLQIFLDPVSGEVLGTRKAVLPPFLTFAHQLHGNFLMSRETGRPIVGWLGVAMCVLGLTGLVLWWPRRGQWKYAFKVRSTATGLRFHRELHAATGIWIFFVFMAVSFSGVVIAWPQTMGMNPPGFNPRVMPTVEVQNGKRLGATEAVIAAQTAVPDLVARTITYPARPDQPVSVNYLSHGAINASVLLDPYTGKVLMVRDNAERFLAWMRPVHDGGNLGPLWRFLVFLSGLVPLLFVVTGIIMWAKKRKRRIPMTTMTDELALADDEDEE
ncbi:MAG: PepSY domain-containing protein [Alphaproteobacteria bacterium]|nr:PepSY domain-containing protein [Alphaproteobacteria bacterium]